MESLAQIHLNFAQKLDNFCSKIRHFLLKNIVIFPKTRTFHVLSPKYKYFSLKNFWPKGFARARDWRPRKSLKESWSRAEFRMVSIFLGDLFTWKGGKCIEWGRNQLLNVKYILKAI